MNFFPFSVRTDSCKKYIFHFLLTKRREITSDFRLKVYVSSHEFFDSKCIFVCFFLEGKGNFNESLVEWYWHSSPSEKYFTIPAPRLQIPKQPLRIFENSFFTLIRDIRIVITRSSGKTKIHIIIRTHDTSEQSRQNEFRVFWLLTVWKCPWRRKTGQDELSMTFFRFFGPGWESARHVRVQRLIPGEFYSFTKNRVLDHTILSNIYIYIDMWTMSFTGRVESLESIVDKGSWRDGAVGKSRLRFNDRIPFSSQSNWWLVSDAVYININYAHVKQYTGWTARIKV